MDCCSSVGVQNIHRDSSDNTRWPSLKVEEKSLLRNVAADQQFVRAGAWEQPSIVVSSLVLDEEVNIAGIEQNVPEEVSCSDFFVDQSFADGFDACVYGNKQLTLTLEQDWAEASDDCGDNGLHSSNETASLASGVVLVHLEDARRLGQVRLRWLRGPTLFLGPCCMLSGLLLFVLKVRFVPRLLFHLGLVLLLLSLVPTDVRCVPLVIAFAGVPSSFLAGILNSYAFFFHIEMVISNSCRFTDDDDDDDDEDDLACPAVALESINYLFGSIASLAICFYLVWCLCKRLNSTVLLQRLWRTLSISFFIIALYDLISYAIRIYAGRSIIDDSRIFDLTQELVFLAITARYHFIVQIQSWLMSRGQAATVAAGVAELLGGKHPDSVLAHARQSFLSIPATQVTYDDMLGNTPRPSLRKKAIKARLGHVDAFVSHSWHDDHALKWAGLQSWCEDFRRNHRGREPTFWIDKYCIDQDNIEESLACLPVYLSGCKTLLILCGPTYLSRLWCLIEIFVFLEMGGELKNLAVRFLEDFTKDDNASDAYTPAESLQTLLYEFECRHAQCSTEEDTLLLQRVLEVSGATKVNRLVNDIFVAKLADARSASAKGKKS